MQFTLYSVTALFVTLCVAVEACTDVNASCPNWVANGFCTSTFYTDAQKTQYCPASCGLCAGSSTTSASSVTSSSGTCADTSPNCATWNSNGFCTSTFYTAAQKAQYCGMTCNLCNGGALTTVPSGVTTQSTATTTA